MGDTAVCYCYESTMSGSASEVTLTVCSVSVAEWPARVCGRWCCIADDVQLRQHTHIHRCSSSD